MKLVKGMKRDREREQEKAQDISSIVEEKGKILGKGILVTSYYQHGKRSTSQLVGTGV